MRYYLYIVGAILLFSSVEVVTKHVALLDPVLLVILRFGTPGLVFLVAGARSFPRVRRKDLLALIGLGLLGVTVTFIPFNYSLRHMDASQASVIASLNPIFSALAATVLLRERITVTRSVGVIMGFGGAYVVSFGFRATTFSSAVGPLLLFGAQITFGVYIALTKRYVQRYGPFIVTGIIFMAGAVACVPVVGSWHIGTWAEGLWAAGYLGLVVAGLGYLLYFHGLSRVPVAAGTSIFYLKPVVGPLIAVGALGDRLRPEFFVGVAVILLSLGLTTFGGKPVIGEEPGEPPA